MPRISNNQKTAPTAAAEIASLSMTDDRHEEIAEHIRAFDICRRMNDVFILMGLENCCPGSQLVLNNKSFGGNWHALKQLYRDNGRDLDPDEFGRLYEYLGLKMHDCRDPKNWLRTTPLRPGLLTPKHVAGLLADPGYGRMNGKSILDFDDDIPF